MISRAHSRLSQRFCSSPRNIQRSMSQNYQNLPQNEWNSSSGYTPTQLSSSDSAHDDSSDAPSVYDRNTPLFGFGNMQQEEPVLNPAYLDPRFIPVYPPAPGFLPLYTTQPQQFQNPLPSPSYPPLPSTAGWPSVLPQQPPYAFPDPAMLPSSSSSYRDPRDFHPSPTSTTPYPPVIPHPQIQLTEVSEEQRASGSTKECSHCHATTTPVWRRDPRTHQTLCNACGLYLLQHQQLRPQRLIDADKQEPRGGGDSEGQYEDEGPECRNCGTRKTSTWRRNKAGEQVCNACGMYERTNGKPRPLVLRSDKIRPREKHRHS